MRDIPPRLTAGGPNTALFGRRARTALFADTESVAVFQSESHLLGRAQTMANWDPWREIDELRREIDRAFGRRFFRGVWRAVTPWLTCRKTASICTLKRWFQESIRMLLS